MTQQPRPRPDTGRLPRRQLLRLGAAAGGVALLGPHKITSVFASHAAGSSAGIHPRPAELSADVPTAWFSYVSDLVRTTPGFSPPVTARAYGYAGVALYEALVSAMADHRSLAQQLNALGEHLPVTIDNPDLDWRLVANAALAGSFRQLFPAGPVTEAIDDFERMIAGPTTPSQRDVATRSRRHGQTVAAAVAAWASGDGGHDGHLRNITEDYTPPTGEGSWEPTPPRYLDPLQPNWGSNRTMLPAIAEVAVAAPPLPYSTDPASAFYAEAAEVYHTVNALTPEQLDIARFWSDDPGATATPAGHSMAILTQVLTARGASLELAAEAYARLGIALSDAFVCCWATKYEHNVLRPITYIRAHIDPNWGDPLPLTTPPFPEYTSGHSVQSGAASRVLTGMFGETSFTDRSSVAARDFATFDQAAEEAAISRLYGGIHYRRAIEEGLRQGRILGDAVNALHTRI